MSPHYLASIYNKLRYSDYKSFTLEFNQSMIVLYEIILCKESA